MLKRVLAALKNNLGLKILSVLIAVIIWYAVVDTNDPVETASFSVRVTVTNESYISSGKQVYRIDDDYKTVTVYVKGNRSALRNLTAENITVTADLTQIVDLDRTPVMVPLTATCPGVNQTNITLSRTAIPITIENVASKEFPVSVSTGDSVPGTNYEVGTLTPNPEQIVINGPESIVNKIDSVQAKIDVTGMTQDGTKKAELQILDKDANALSEETIEDDLTFDGGMPNIEVAVDLWERRSDVALEIDYSGTPAPGYNVTDVTTNPETITVVGSDTALAALAENGNKITISDPAVTVQDATEDISVDLTLQDKLPEGLRLSSTMADAVSVNITILSDETREIKLDVDDIVTDNLSSNLTVSYDQTELTVRVKGPGQIIDRMKADDITASIDLTARTAGDYTVAVNVTLPDDVELAQAVTIPIHLKERASETDAAQENGAEAE